MSDTNEYSRLKICLEVIREKTDFVPEVAVVLGSGLGSFGEKIKARCIIDYSGLPDFPVSTVSGHKGRFILGYLDEVPVIVMQGRVHYYEGYSMNDVVMPIRLMRMLGAKAVFMTNAAGGINFDAGSIVLINDHISTFVPSPLRGSNIDELGERFPDMTEVYDFKIREAVLKVAEANSIKLEQGVYLQLSGPNYETPQEIKMSKTLGADVVGMSTAVEAMAARHIGLKVCAISCVTNKAAGLSGRSLSHDEVKRESQKMSEKLEKLLLESVKTVHDKILTNCE